jgi:Holliday junction resolvasome RuvABC endonuclease subunit
MSTILALDLGTQTGWSLLHKSIITSGTLTFKNDRYQGVGMRFLRFSKWLEDIKGLAGGTLGEVYFEEVRRHLGVDAAHAYGGFLATLTSWCEREGVAYQGVSVGSIKRHATGKGNASKQEVIKAMETIGYQPKDDNEADALALLELIIKQNKKGK